MKIISYNLNGLRAATKLNVLNWIKQEDADIICLQEVREEQNVCEEIFKKILFT
jgi:exodeoxyribonuclease-3